MSEIHIYTPAEARAILKLGRSRYYELTRPDSRGVVMLEYCRTGAGGARRHTWEQIRDCLERMSQLGNARVVDLKGLARGGNHARRRAA